MPKNQINFAWPWYKGLQQPAIQKAQHWKLFERSIPKSGCPDVDHNFAHHQCLRHWTQTESIPGCLGQLQVFSVSWVGQKIKNSHSQGISVLCFPVQRRGGFLLKLFHRILWNILLSCTYNRHNPTQQFSWVVYSLKQDLLYFWMTMRGVVTLIPSLAKSLSIRTSQIPWYLPRNPNGVFCQFM